MAMASEDPGVASTSPSQRTLRRSKTDQVIGGVCGGLAGYFGLDPILFRIAFVILTVAGGGIGVPLYLVAWIVIPEGDSTPPSGESRPMNGGSLIVGSIFIALGIGMLADMVMPWFDRLLWPSLLVGLGVFVLLGTRKAGDK